MTSTIFISIALLVVCWGIPNTNFLCGHVLCSAMNFSQKKLYISLSGPCQPHVQICRGRSRGPPHSPPKWWQPRKSCLCHHRISPVHTLRSHCLGPTGDLSVLIWQPCVEKSSLQIQRCVLLERNMIPENSYLCFFHIDRQSRPPRGAGGDRCWTNSRCKLGRRIERGLVNWFDV